MDTGIRVDEDVPGDGPVIGRGDTVSFDLQLSLNRGEIVHLRQATTVRVGDRNVFAGLTKSLEGMRRGGYRKTRVSPHLAYGAKGVAGKIPPDAVLICEIWLAPAGGAAGPVV